jgi:hypothetical protein
VAKEAHDEERAGLQVCEGRARHSKIVFPSNEHEQRRASIPRLSFFRVLSFDKRVLCFLFYPTMGDPLSPEELQALRVLLNRPVPDPEGEEIAAAAAPLIREVSPLLGSGASASEPAPGWLTHLFPDGLGPFQLPAGTPKDGRLFSSFDSVGAALQQQTEPAARAFAYEWKYLRYSLAWILYTTQVLDEVIDAVDAEGIGPLEHTNIVDVIKSVHSIQKEVVENLHRRASVPIAAATSSLQLAYKLSANLELKASGLHPDAASIAKDFKEDKTKKEPFKKQQAKKGTKPPTPKQGQAAQGGN